MAHGHAGAISVPTRTIIENILANLATAVGDARCSSTTLA